MAEGGRDGGRGGGSGGGGESTALDASQYLKQRVDDQLEYYSGAATRAKRTHYWLQGVMISLAATVPVVVNLPDMVGEADISSEVRIAATVFSLVVAVLGGLANFRRDGDLWLNFRLTEELLKQEKYLFKTSAGPYAELPDAPKQLAQLSQRVEALLATEHGKFRAVFEDARRGVKSDESGERDG